MLCPLVVALLFSSRLCLLPAFVARRTVLGLVAVTVEILAVFSIYIFQDKVRDEGLKLCARLWYEKRKVSAKCCQIGVLLRQHGPSHLEFSLEM